MLTSLAPSNSSPSGLLNVNGTLFFEANDGTHGLQLWKSDGTVAGTTMVTNFSQGLSNFTQGLAGNFTSPIAFNGNVFFEVSNPTGSYPPALWKSDGTAAGTVPLAGVSVSDWMVLDNVLYFAGSTSIGGNFQLWKSDGTPSGTVPLTTIVLRLSISVVGNFLYDDRYGTPRICRNIPNLKILRSRPDEASLALFFGKITRLLAHVAGSISIVVPIAALLLASILMYYVVDFSLAQFRLYQEALRAARIASFLANLF
jgi:ELWxxDGT repeat protein